MMRVAALTCAALLLTAGCIPVPPTITPGSPPVLLAPEQCKAVWSKAVAGGDTPEQAGTAGDVVGFAQVDDFAQVDANNDGIVEEKEFEAVCGKGLMHAPR